MKMKSCNIEKLNAAQICAYSFFPEELPPCYQSKQLGQWAAKLSKNDKSNLLGKSADRFKVDSLDTYGARYGVLIRKYSTPSPNAFIKLVLELETSKKELARHIEQSSLSASKPTTNHKYRGLGLTYRFRELNNLKKYFSKKRKWLFKSDIAHCYPSFYTHSIAWAIHGRIEAKKNIRSWGLLGNRIDTFIMDSQGGETKGIPIGPDTSRVISEIILSAVDTSLSQSFAHGFRYMDDYWMFCESKAEAEDCLGVLQIELMKYRLNVSPTKTQIIEHRNIFEDFWVKEIKKRIPITPHGYSNDSKYRILLSECLDKYPHTPAIKYLFSSIMNNCNVKKIDDAFVELAIDYVISEPSLIPELIKSLNRVKVFDDYLDLINEKFYELIPLCIRMGHHIELAWILWISLHKHRKIDKKLMMEASKVDSNFISLLLMSHIESGLCEQIQIPMLDEVLELHSDSSYLGNWLFRYECALKGWLDPKPLSNLGLNNLFNDGVSFFDENIGDGKWYHWAREYL